jgi:predicted outer membrane repeat protein
MAAPSLPLFDSSPATPDAAPQPLPTVVETSLEATRISTPNSVFTVVNTSDAGAGSLRDAVTQANAAAGHDQIQFNLSGCPCTITLLSELATTGELTVIGPGTSKLTLSGNNANRIFSTTAGNPLHLSEMTLANGFHASQGGGAVSAGDLSLTNVIVRNSSATFGGGVNTTGALTLMNTTFDSNTATTSSGGGAYVGQNLIATDSTFLKNSAYADGGGAYVNGLATITGGSFDQNKTTQVKAYGGGGGLMAFNITKLSGTQFIQNTTPAWGGGAYLANFPTGTINHLSNATFTGNQSAYGGGGLFQWFSAIVTDTQFINNQAGTQGGGVYAGYAGNYAIQITGGQILSNTANTGGGLYSDCSFTLYGVTVKANTANNGHGGGAATQTSASISNSTFSNNKTIAGGHGGGLSALVSAAITDTLFQKNSVLGSFGGGGLVVGSTQGVGTTSLLRVTFSQNSNASGFGGGMLSYGTTRLVDSTFTGNTSWNDGGGAWVGGPLTLIGGLFQGNSTVLNESNGGGGGLMSYHRAEIESTQFISNTTPDWGGGAYIYNPFTQNGSEFTNVTFTGNQAVTGGGGGMFSWFTTTLTAPTFTDNYAGWRGGGLYASYSGNYKPTLNGGLFQQNSATGGGGLFSEADITLSSVDFYTNTARNGNGGGIWTGRSATVSDAYITYNVVITGGNSGGIDTAADLILTNSTLFNNRNLYGSGGGSGAGGNATVSNSHYISNTARLDGGGLLAYGTAQVTDSSFLNNKSGNVGGGIATNHARIDASQVEGNTATGNNGGGVFANVSIVVTDTNFIHNTTEYAGGAIFTGGQMNLRQAAFIANQADSGGAVYQNAGDGLIVNTLFARNHAVNLIGEALYLKPTAAFSIQFSTVASPTLAAGSAIFFNSGTPTLLNSIVTSHTLGIVQAAGSLNADYNLLFGNLINTQGSVTNNHPVSGKPGFFNPWLDDYHLGVGSAAVNAGPNIGVSVDFDGDVRPQGSGFDLGYDEVAPPEGLTASNNGPTTLGNPTAFSSSLTYGMAVTYLWHFDDGTTSTGNSPVHTYAAAGIYHVTVTAANGAGSVSASTDVMVVATTRKIFLPAILR